MKPTKHFIAVLTLGLGAWDFGLGIWNCSAQDIHFSQFYESPLTLNPALGGLYNGQIRVGMNYRNQWSGITSNPYNTYALYGDMKKTIKLWESGYIAPGISIFRDEAGKSKIGITQVNAVLASGIYLSRKITLAAGLLGGFSHHSMSMEQLRWGEQYENGKVNAGIPTGEPGRGESFSYADFGTGLVFNYSSGSSGMIANDAFNTTLGFAWYHANKPSFTYYGQSGKGLDLFGRMVIHGIMEIGSKKSNMSIIPSFAHYIQGPSRETDLGMKFRYLLRKESQYTGYKEGTAFSMGVLYRYDDAVVLLAQIELGKWAAGFSYDINTSRLAGAGGITGGPEVSLRYINPNPFRYKKSTNSMF